MPQKGDHMRRIDLVPGAKCYKCKGCHELKEPTFEGKKECPFFERKDKRVWCADETVKDYLRKQRIKKLLG